MAPLKWINNLERKFKKLAIKNLILHIVMLTLLVYILNLLDQRGILLYNLALIPQRVFRGEVWRLFTYIFIPPLRNPLFLFFALYLLYLMGSGLERVWGTFRFNLFYFVGLLATSLVSLLTGIGVTADYINLSIFLAFARLYPDFELVLFFVLPIKVKYLAVINWIFIVYTIITAPLSVKITVLVALANYFLFFGKEILEDLRLRKKVYNNRKRFDVIRYEGKKTIHQCTICGITEKDDPEMEFRYCSKCAGAYEYCSKHLRDHQHIQDGDN